MLAQQGHNWQDETGPSVATCADVWHAQRDEMRRDALTKASVSGALAIIGPAAYSIMAHVAFTVPSLRTMAIVYGEPCTSYDFGRLVVANAATLETFVWYPSNGVDFVESTDGGLDMPRLAHITMKLVSPSPRRGDGDGAAAPLWLPLHFGWRTPALLTLALVHHRELSHAQADAMAASVHSSYPSLARVSFVRALHGVPWKSVDK